MTIAINQTGRLKTVATRLATTAATGVYTAPAGARPIVLGIRVANTTGSAVTAIVALRDAASASDAQLTGTASIAANGAIEIAGMPLALLDGDAIRVTAGTGSNALHVVVTALEAAGR